MVRTYQSEPARRRQLDKWLHTYKTDPADLPAERTAYAMRDLEHLKRLAGDAGPAVGAYATAVLDHAHAASHPAITSSVVCRNVNHTKLCLE